MVRYYTIGSVVVLSMLIFAAPAAIAKCRQPIYEVSGLVTDEVGKPAAAALVGVSWIERGHVEGPILGVSDNAGHYVLRFRFDKYTGTAILFGESCKGVLSEVSIGAYREGNRSEELHLSVYREKISVPPLILGYRAL